MKKTWCLTLIAVFTVGTLLAQTTVELIPTGGYTFPDQVNFYNTYGRIEGGPNYGGSLQFNVNRNFGIELMYNRMEGSSAMYYFGQPQQPMNQQDVAINYIMVGPVQSINFPGSPVHLFLGGLIGAAVFSPGPADYTGNTKFAWGFEGGTNIYLNPHVGIRLKAQLLSPVEGASGGFYFGNWGGGVGVTTYSAIYQFGFSGGLIIGLGNVLPKPRPRVIYQKRYYYRPAPPPPPRPYYYY